MNTAPTPAPPPAAARRMRTAVAAQQRGDQAAASALFAELTRDYPRFADAWHFHGLLLHQRGERERALEMLARALSLEPENFSLLLNFGRVLGEIGQLARSIECLSRAHKLRPDSDPALFALTQSLLACDRGGEMTAAIERRLERAGAHWQLCMLLGECREQGGDRAGALGAYAEAARLAPTGEPGPRLARASAANRDSQPELAATEFQAALTAAPDSAEARLGLADLASQAGDFARAENLLREALARAPDLHSGWVALAATHKIVPEDPLGKELDAVAAQADANAPDLWGLHIARGQVWEKLGDYEHAWPAYALGNRLRHQARPYAREAHEAYTRGIITNLDKDFVARAAGIGLTDPGVIYICGMPRSGTTLVETILAAHPEVRAGGELNHIHDWLRRRIGTAGMNSSGVWLGAAADETLAEMAQYWRERLIETAAGSPRVTDKLPGNYALLGLIHVCFPTAPIVYVRRDPRDICFSCYATVFADRHNFSYALDALAHNYRLHENLMEHWRQTLGGERIIEIEYEKLVHDPEGEIRRLLAALGLAWHPDCLDFHRAAREVRTASLYQVRQPLYTRSIGRWRHFEHHLQPLLEALPPSFCSVIPGPPTGGTRNLS
ncbi:MAG: tetratricopeptide repeat-containing sulfotransferase family protein [Gammaproteobacteria bacterium]